MKAVKNIAIHGILLLACQTLVIAQNPLRAAGQDSPTQHRATFVEADSYQQSPGTDYGQRTEATDDRFGSRIEPPRFDSNVVPAGFEQIPVPGQTLNSLGQQTETPLATATTAVSTDPNRLLDLIMKISLNLVFVLTFAVGVLLVARRWMKPKVAGSGKDRAAADELSVRDTLQLDHRVTIRLVQWRTNRFLIACDQNGIQSVNPLNASFEQTIEQLDQDAMEERLIRKFVGGENLNVKAA